MVRPREIAPAAAVRKQAHRIRRATTVMAVCRGDPTPPLSVQRELPTSILRWPWERAGPARSCFGIPRGLSHSHFGLFFGLAPRTEGAHRTNCRRGDPAAAP